ncbi:MAG: S9 family peptidase [Planctomycetota bacterium]|nr:S9 family peptidase [Planctomycetota bacterium]
MTPRSTFVLLFAASCALPMPHDSAVPPVARRVHHENRWHGQVYEDDYYWLRNKEAPEVRAYLEAENAYTARRTAHLKPLEDRLYEELVARVQQTDQAVPVRLRGYHYYTRTVEGLQYPIRCRRRATDAGAYDPGAPEQVLLDQNAMAAGLDFLSIGDTCVSDDDDRYAYTTDVTGFRQYTLHVKELETGAEHRDLAERVTAVVWSADGETLFYVTEDAITKRSDKLWRLRVGGAPELLFEELDELYRINVMRTRDHRYVLCGSTSTDTYEWRYLDAADPGGDFKVLLPREKGHRYSPTHRDGAWYLRTDKDALNFRVVRAPVDDPRPGGWVEVVPHRDDVFVDRFDVFADYAVVQEKQLGVTRFRVHDFASGSWREIAFPEAVYAASSGGNPEWTSTSYRIDYQSMVSPPCVFDYDLASLERELKKQREVHGYDPARYETVRVYPEARDGAKIPVSLVYKKGTPRDGSAPMWLYGYGSYGASMPASFNSDRISLLDRGVVYAIAHIRGSRTLGEAWRRDGMLMKKKNTFYDFIDAAEGLIDAGWTSKARLLAEGGSAGGLLMGAVANLRPDLFCGIHSAVPFVDVMNTMMDSSMPLTVGEYLEWGNPNEKPAFDYMMSYSPYDNLEAKAYPATLVTTSFNDSQVMYWEPAKYVAKLRTLKTDDEELLLKTKLEAAGHGGASGRYDRWRDRAFEMAWMLTRAGVTQ